MTRSFSLVFIGLAWRVKASPRGDLYSRSSYISITGFDILFIVKIKCDVLAKMKKEGERERGHLCSHNIIETAFHSFRVWLRGKKSDNERQIAIPLTIINTKSRNNSRESFYFFENVRPIRSMWPISAVAAAAWYRSTMTLLNRAWQTYKELTTLALRRTCTRAFVRSHGTTAEEGPGGPARPGGDGRHNSSSSCRQQVPVSWTIRTYSTGSLVTLRP